MAQSTAAGIVTAFGVLALLMTAIAGLITAFAARRTSKRVEARVAETHSAVQEIHVIVNQQRTDMLELIVAQRRREQLLETALTMAGVAIPDSPEVTR